MYFYGNASVGKSIYGLKLEGKKGKWDEIDRLIKDGVTYLLLESREYGDTVPYIIIEKPPRGTAKQFGYIPKEYIFRKTIYGLEVLYELY